MRPRMGQRMRSSRAAVVSGGAALLCLLAATIVSGTRPNLEQGIAPTALSLASYGLGILSALLFLAMGRRGTHPRTGLAAALTGGGALVLLVVELTVIGEPRGGADIAQGLVRLIAIGALLSGVVVGWRTRGPDLADAV